MTHAGCVVLWSPARHASGRRSDAGRATTNEEMTGHYQKRFPQLRMLLDARQA